jgi:hypothetical protein
VLLFAVSRDGQGLSKGKPDRFVRVDPAEILDPLSIAPGIGLQGQGNHRDTGPSGQFDADGIELLNMGTGSLLVVSINEQKRLSPAH